MFPRCWNLETAAAASRLAALRGSEAREARAGMAKCGNTRCFWYVFVLHMQSIIHLIVHVQIHSSTHFIEQALWLSVWFTFYWYIMIYFTVTFFPTVMRPPFRCRRDGSTGDQGPKLPRRFAPKSLPCVAKVHKCIFDNGNRTRLLHTMLIHINWNEVIGTWPQVWSMGTWGLSKLLSEERQLQNKAFTFMNLEMLPSICRATATQALTSVQFQVDSSFRPDGFEDVLEMSGFSTHRFFFSKQKVRQLDGALESGEKGSLEAHQIDGSSASYKFHHFHPLPPIVSFPKS